MREKFKSETELAEQVIKYLKDLKWEVYQEVQIASYGSIADIVAVKNGLVWIIECKLSLSLDVIGQAECWTRHANYTSVAVPASLKDSKGRDFAYKILKQYGIGCFEMPHPDSYSYRSHLQRIQSKLNRTAITSLIKRSLCEEQKTWAKAGNSKGSRYTPFQDTTNQILRAVANKPGMTFKELMNEINHHYSSDTCARSSILQWIHRGVIKGVRLKLKGKNYTLYLEKKKCKRKNK